MIQRSSSGSLRKARRSAECSSFDRSSVEAPTGAGNFWFALSHEDPPEADLELHPVERSGFPWHVGDVFTRGLANVRGIDVAEHSGPTIETLLERMRRIVLRHRPGSVG
jgi:hypothetical protein